MNNSLYIVKDENIKENFIGFYGKRRNEGT